MQCVYTVVLNLVILLIAFGTVVPYNIGTVREVSTTVPIRSNPHSTRAQKSKSFVESLNGENDVIVIPSTKDIQGEDVDTIEDVAAYCRVSTMSEQQVESYELQKAYYEEMVERHPNWNLIDIYPDEGISATSMKQRKNFLRMIEDCKKGKISMIVTKSVSRFARNVVDAISTIRMLRNLHRPVAVYFETEHINTLAPGADAQLSLLASFAESESLNKSLSMKWAIRSRFAHGIPRIVDTYGLTRVHNNFSFDLTRSIEPHVVRWIYYAFTKGMTLSAIQKRLHTHHIRSPSGKEWWSKSSLVYILSNEKYVGNVLMQKTVRVDMFLHRSVKNTGQERQFFRKNYASPLIPYDVWLKAQLILGNGNLNDYLSEEYVTVFGDDSLEMRYLQFPPQIK